MDEKNETKAVKIVSLESAQKKIEKALSKAGVEHDTEQIHEALTTLYAAYEADGVQPTREAFAECCKDQEAGRFVKEMERDPFSADNTKKIAAVIVAVVIIAIAACAVAFGLNNQNSSQPESVPTPAASAQAETAVVDVTIKAEGTTADSTKVKAEILDEAGEAVVSAMEITANEKTFVGDLEQGKYSLRVVQAPVNTDGSTYKLPENPTEFTVEADGSPASVEITLEKLAVEDMSKEQLEATAKILEDNGKTNEANTIKAEATAAPSRPGSAGDIAAEPTPAPGNPSSGNSGSNSGNSGNSDSKPTHTHNWVEQTKTVHHDAEYKTVHHDAVTKSATICNQCGADITGNVAGHLKDALKNGTGCESYRNETIVIKEAYDEKVLIKDAWDETVVTGYKCSGCGATK